MALADPGHEGRMDDLNMSDVHNLMACVCNASLPDAVRSSALQRLSSEVQEPAFLAAVAVPSFLEEVLQCVECCVAGLLGGNSAWCSETPTAIHSVQLCAHSLFLLGALCCRSQGVLVSSWGYFHCVYMLACAPYHTRERCNTTRLQCVHLCAGLDTRTDAPCDCVAASSVPSHYSSQKRHGCLSGAHSLLASRGPDGTGVANQQCTVSYSTVNNPLYCVPRAVSHAPPCHGAAA